MSIYIAMKHPACFGYAADGHHFYAPPPVFATKMPCQPHVLLSNWAAPLHWVFGKFTDGRHATDGMGTMLWGHDWGPLKVHITGVPNPALIAIPFGACLKLQLPAATLQKPATGGAMHAGTTGPPAAAFSIGVIPCQTCWDIMGFGFVMPTGIHLTSPTGEFVPVTFGCWFAAFACGMADGLFALAGSIFGCNFASKFGGAVNSLIMAVIGATFRTKFIAYLLSPLIMAGAIPAAITAEVIFGAGGEAIMMGSLLTGVAALVMAPGLLLEMAGNAIVEEESGGVEPATE